MHDKKDPRGSSCRSARACALAALGLLATLLVNTRIGAQVVWGFADLHAHPASHFGFGADATGHNGVIWGVPMTLPSSAADNIATDLPACNTTTHDNSLGWLDFRTPRIHQTVLQQVDKLTQVDSMASGGELGSPTYQTWPAARLIAHQQMHITAIKRAYDGGLRLMMADATDSQLISQLWRYNGQTMTPDSNSDMKQAVAQLQYIRSLAGANSGWMQVVQSPAEARAAITANKLAIVLGVEMDSLAPSQVLSLVRDNGVRHVVPIHLANNSFGGSAAYSSSFDSNSFFLNGEWQSVVWDNCVNFQYKVNDLTSISYGSCPWLFWQTCPNPTPIDAALFHQLHYDAPPLGSQGPGGVILCNTGKCGVRNPLGIGDNLAITALMQAGVLLDIVHMSQVAAAATLDLAERYQYPVMDSHTGIRDDNPQTCLVYNGTTNRQIDERALPYSQATRIAKLGGVIGLGTGRNPTADPAQDPFGEWLADYRQLASLGFTNGNGIALGTDTNGLSNQIPGDTQNRAFTYPFVNVGSTDNPPWPLPPQFSQYSIGPQNYDIRTHGVATYGLLPDFIAFEASIAASAGGANLDALFHSAEATIKMWEIALASASANFPCGAGMKCCGVNNNSNCIGTCVSNTATCTSPPPPCPGGEKCCGGTDANGHCIGACIASTSACTASNVCPSGQHCCSGISSTDQCRAGCVTNATACQSLCAPNDGNKCCGDPLPTGRCDRNCIKSPPALCP